MNLFERYFRASGLRSASPSVFCSQVMPGVFSRYRRSGDCPRQICRSVYLSGYDT
ncbi:hypothetical protein KCP71_16745 [Salmonella enterica subsp. enterica]|nr:hypothetical protein KCP71_16745 [Salmonella enterica subsp. enterica]